MMFHVLSLASRRSCFPFALGRSPPVCLHSMDTILRLLEGLRRDEIVWLNTYLTGRLRAMPPPAAAAATTHVSAVPAHVGVAGDSVDEVPVAALAERVGDFNISMDPWEQTGAAPHGWAPHLHQTVIPMYSYDLTTPLSPPLEVALRPLLELLTKLSRRKLQFGKVEEKRRHR